MDRGFRNDICVEAIAKIDRVNVVTLKIAVHNREKHLQEQIDGIYQYRQQVQPSLAGHHDWSLLNRVYTRFLQAACMGFRGGLRCNVRGCGYVRWLGRRLRGVLEDRREGVAASEAWRKSWDSGRKADGGLGSRETRTRKLL